MRTRPRQTWPPGGWPARAAAAGCGRGHGPPHAWCASWTARRPGCGLAGHAARRAGARRCCCPAGACPGAPTPRRSSARRWSPTPREPVTARSPLSCAVRRPPSAGGQHTQWLRTRGIQAAARLERETLVGMVWRPQPTALAHALSALGAAALAYHRWLYPRAPAWTLITIITGGRLLAPSG